MTLCTTRHNSIYKNILTKCLSHNYNRLTSISQLFADHSSISVVPGVVTHCPPLVIDVQLHSTLILIRTSHQTNISIGIVATCINYMTIIKVTSKQWLKQNHFIITFTFCPSTSTCIPIPQWRGVVTVDSRATWAVREVILTATTLYFIQINWTSTNTKASISKGHSICWCNPN